MTAFLVGLILGIIIGAFLGSLVAKIGNIPDQVTNISGGKQVIKDSPGALISSELNQNEQPIEKKRIFGKLINKLKKNKDEKL